MFTTFAHHVLSSPYLLTGKSNNPKNLYFSVDYEYYLIAFDVLTSKPEFAVSLHVPFVHRLAIYSKNSILMLKANIFQC